MRVVLFSLAMAGLLAVERGVNAQLPPAASATRVDTMPAYPDGCVPCPSKVCLPEVKHTTKVVYGSVVKEYCRPRTSFSGMFHTMFGPGSCSDCERNDVRTYRVLMKKIVPGPDVQKCVVKDLSPVMKATPPPSKKAVSFFHLPLFRTHPEKVENPADDRLSSLPGWLRNTAVPNPPSSAMPLARDRR